MTFMSHVVDHRPDLQPAGVALPVVELDPFSRFLHRVATRIPRMSTPVLIGLCFAGGVAYTLASNPTDANAAASPTCLVKLTTGFDCPGCGGTRAFWYVLHGNIPAAARSHLLAVFAAPFLAYVYVVWAARVIFKKHLPPLRISPTAMGIFFGVWGVWAILRNLPWAPFTWFFV